jgi:hypothetical protein
VSNKLQALVWAHKMTHSQQAVMLALADSGHDDGSNIYPSFGYLAWKTEYSVRQVMRIVGELRKLGAVKRIRRGNSQKRSNEYRLNFDVFERKPPWKTTSDKMSLLDIQLVTPRAPTSDISGSTSDIAMSHQSSSESPVKHKKRAREIPKGSGASEETKKRAVVDYWQKLAPAQRTVTTIAMLSGASIEDVERWRPQ